MEDSYLYHQEAHGFLCVRDANVLYVQGGHFNPPLEVDISPFDKELDIFWPCPGVRYIMSSKDMNAQTMQHFIPRSLSFKRKRILVIGASGQLGCAIRRTFSNDIVFGTCNMNPTKEFSYKLDLSDMGSNCDKLEFIFGATRPQIASLRWIHLGRWLNVM